MVVFRVHKPFKHVIGEKGTRPGKCMEEIELLNYQTLYELREKIFCEADYQDTAGNIGDWPYGPIKKLAKVSLSSLKYIPTQMTLLIPLSKLKWLKLSQLGLIKKRK